MEEFLSFLKNYASLLNTGLIVAITGIAFKAYQALIAKKDAELALVRERLQSLSDFSIENVNERFVALKNYYEKGLHDWHEASMQTLEEEKRKAIEQKQKEFEEKIKIEIRKRKELVASYEDRDLPVSQLDISTAEACGKYSVTGSNPQSPGTTYFGELEIAVAKNGSLVGNWLIGPRRQPIQGIGILQGDTIAFVFVSDLSFRMPGMSQTGVVLYEFITHDVLRGQWSAFPGGMINAAARLITERSAGQLGVEEIRRLPDV